MKVEKQTLFYSRIQSLLPKLIKKPLRHIYLETHIKGFIASQIRALRGDLTQKQFAKVLGVKQSIVSRYEDPDYGRVTVQTLIDIANRLDIALMVRFVDYPTFMYQTSDFSSSARSPKKYDNHDMKLLADSLAPTLINTVPAPTQASQKYAGYSYMNNSTGAVVHGR